MSAANRHCELTRVARHCTRTIRDAGGDAFGGELSGFVCCELQCDDASVALYGVAAVTEFGAHLGDISTKKPTPCVPVETDLVP